MSDRLADDVLSMTTTVATVAEAQRLARGLVERRLAACVQIDAGLESHYRWQGDLCAEPEVRLTLKTLRACLPAVRRFIDENHPYDLPQLLWQAQAASEAYATWVRSEVSVPGGG